VRANVLLGFLSVEERQPIQLQLGGTDFFLLDVADLRGAIVGSASEGLRDSQMYMRREIAELVLIGEVDELGFRK
jgi:hypothetical protein